MPLSCAVLCGSTGCSSCSYGWSIPQPLLLCYILKFTLVRTWTCSYNLLLIFVISYIITVTDVYTVWWNGLSCWHWSFFKWKSGQLDFQSALSDFDSFRGRSQGSILPVVIIPDIQNKLDKQCKYENLEVERAERSTVRGTKGWVLLLTNCKSEIKLWALGRIGRRLWHNPDTIVKVSKAFWWQALATASLRVIRSELLYSCHYHCLFTLLLLSHLAFLKQ